MIDTIHFLIEKYGLVAVFLGCLAEGESAALLAGFFAHQRIFEPWQAFAVVACGAFLGDTALFLAGRRFSRHRYVAGLRTKPGFAQADNLIRRYPKLFVFCNRYIYGLRLVGGIAAGLSDIAIRDFVVLNALSSLVWAALFGGAGYFLGLGAERIIGSALAEHQRLVIGFGAALVVAILAGWVAHRYARRADKR